MPPVWEGAITSTGDDIMKYTLKAVNLIDFTWFTGRTDANFFKCTGFGIQVVETGAFISLSKDMETPYCLQRKKYAQAAIDGGINLDHEQVSFIFPRELADLEEALFV